MRNDTKLDLFKFIQRADSLVTRSSDKKLHGRARRVLNHLLYIVVNIAYRPVTAPVAGVGMSLVHIDNKQDIDVFTAQDPIIKNA